MVAYNEPLAPCLAKRWFVFLNFMDNFVGGLFPVYADSYNRHGVGLEETWERIARLATIH